MPWDNLITMSSPGKRWYHATFGTHNSWLPGDPRGFRNKQHRIHSSGDHRNPPPKGEHAGLHAHAKSISGDTVMLCPSQREVAGLALQQTMEKHGHKLLIIAVGGMHVHMLVELPNELRKAKNAIGYAKMAASMRLKDDLPSKVWARGGNNKPIRDEEHHRNTFKYILDHRTEGAWVWTFRDEEG